MLEFACLPAFVVVSSRKTRLGGNSRLLEADQQIKPHFAFCSRAAPVLSRAAFMPLFFLLALAAIVLVYLSLYSGACGFFLLFSHTDSSGVVIQITSWHLRWGLFPHQ